MHIIVVLYKFTRLHTQKGPINLKVVSAGEFMGNGTVVRVAAPHEVQKWKRSVIAEAKLTRHVVVLVWEPGGNPLSLWNQPEPALDELTLRSNPA